MPLGSGSDLDWPDLEDLKRRIDVQELEVHDGELEVILAAGIAQIKIDVGDWDELVDLPDEALAEAALERAVELSQDTLKPRSERRSLALLKGHRRRFSVG